MKPDVPAGLFAEKSIFFDPSCGLPIHSKSVNPQNIWDWAEGNAGMGVA